MTGLIVPAAYIPVLEIDGRSEQTKFLVSGLHIDRKESQLMSRCRPDAGETFMVNVMKPKDLAVDLQNLELLQ
jgi:hypothetical protein